MILTGKQLEKMGRDIWDPEWAAVLAKRLGLTKKQVYGLRDRGDRAVPISISDAVIAMAEDKLNAIAKWVDRAHDCGDLDAA